MSRKIRSTALVLVLSVLFVSSAYAAPPTFQGNQSILAALWHWLASFASPGSGTPEIQEKAGSQMDPNGATVYDTLLSNSSIDDGRFMAQNGNK
jgi:hypothetical protein